MIPFPLFLAGKYLKPKRTFVSVVMVISVIGVILGVAILIIVMSVMTGFDEMWREKILNFKPHITVTSTEGIIEGEEELCRRIEKIGGITGVAPCVTTRVLVQHDGRTMAPMVIGVDPARAGQVSRVPQHIAAGRFDIEEENTVLGIDLASYLALGLGETALVYSPLNVIAKDEMYLPEELTVTGVYDLGMRDFDAGFMLTSIGLARELVGMEKGAHSLNIMTDDPFKFGEYSARVRRELGQGYIVRTWNDLDRLMFEALSHEKGLMGVLLGIITLVAIFCVTNTLIVITYQKTNEIGLLKALGVPSWKIMFTFVLLGWIQCLVGILIGIGTGYLVLSNLDGISMLLSRMNVDAFPKEIYGLSQLPWTWSWSEIGFISVLVIVFCTLTSLFPAARAVWLDPVEALRHE